MHPIPGVRPPGEESGEVEGAREELDTTHAQRAGVAVLPLDVLLLTPFWAARCPPVLGRGGFWQCRRLHAAVRWDTRERSVTPVQEGGQCRAL